MGNGLLLVQLLSAKRFYCHPVPVIAIFTKFDSLIAQIFARQMDLDELQKAAMDLLHDNLQVPLQNCKFPPRAYIHLEGMLCD